LWIKPITRSKSREKVFPGSEENEYLDSDKETVSMTKVAAFLKHRNGCGNVNYEINE
jgi:hypothetical protein